MAASKRVYERPTIVDLGSITDHTYCDPAVRPFKGGGYIVHCDKHNEWSGGTGENKGTCTCTNPNRDANDDD
jgi:hypothetical protein